MIICSNVGLDRFRPPELFIRWLIESVLPSFSCLFIFTSSEFKIYISGECYQRIENSIEEKETNRL